MSNENSQAGNKNTVKLPYKPMFIHFSFRRPKDENYGIFAAVAYGNSQYKKEIIRFVQKCDLWADHQFVAAAQSYERVLSVIHRWQGMMKAANVTNIFLVTDNSRLSGWIENHQKNKHYTEHMEKAVEAYRSGGPKNISIPIGLASVVPYEKAHKYCKDEYIMADYTQAGSKIDTKGKNLLSIDGGMTVMDILNTGASSNVEVKFAEVSVD